MWLFEQQHLLRDDMISSDEPVEVYSARQTRAVELNLVPSHVLLFIYERLNLLSEHVVYLQHYM